MTARRPLRLCHLAYSFQENDNRVMRYAEALAERGDMVDVIALRRAGPSSTRTRGPRVLSSSSTLGRSTTIKALTSLSLRSPGSVTACPEAGSTSTATVLPASPCGSIYLHWGGAIAW